MNKSHDIYLMRVDWFSVDWSPEILQVIKLALRWHKFAINYNFMLDLDIVAILAYNAVISWHRFFVILIISHGDNLKCVANSYINQFIIVVYYFQHGKCSEFYFKLWCTYHTQKPIQRLTIVFDHWQTLSTLHVSFMQTVSY